MLVGDELGVVEGTYQPMKLAAAEAQWTTCQPCSFSLFQIGGGNNDHTPTQIFEIPYLVAYWFCSGVIPTTLPFQWLVASSDSRCGISKIWVGVWSLFPPPIWNSENEHGWQVVHCASAAAIFIGW